MKVLVTGSSGFIGVELVKSISGCIKPNRDNIINTIIDEKPDVVFHLAANPLIKTNDINSIYESNIKLTKDILDNCSTNCHLIFASSAAVYGDIKRGEQATELSPTIPTSLYGETKLISERLINMYVLSGHIKATILRLVANVGKNPTHGVLKDLLYKYHNNPTLEILGDFPGSVKPYINVQDTVRVMVHCMKNNVFGTYNISTSKPLSVLNIANIIEDKYKLNKKQVWLGKQSNWVGDNPYVNISNWKIKETGIDLLYPKSEDAIYATF